MEGRGMRIGLAAWTVLVVAFLWLPLLLICVYAFNSSNIQDWPLPGYSTKWFSTAWEDQEVRDALKLSIKAALGATAIAMLLGSALAFALHRFTFFGRDAISFLFVLPIALPGIVTGMSLNRFYSEAGIECRVRRITAEEYGAAAPRPAYSVLRSERGAPALPHWQEGLRACLARL